MKISNPVELGRFLKTAQRGSSWIIAVRAALRVFPLWTPPDGQTAFSLALFRCLFISAAAAVWPAPEMKRAARAAGSATNAAVRAADDDATDPSRRAAADAAAAARACVGDALYVDTLYAVNLTAAAVAYAYAPYVADANVALASEAVGFRVDPASADAAIWRQIEADANFLQTSVKNASALYARLRAPLWDHAPLQIIDLAWSDRESELQRRADEHWSPWIEWYDRILAGEALAFSGLTPEQDQAFCVRLATESNDFWERDVAVVNKDILDRLTELREKNLPKAPTIPPQRPASIQPVWRGETLTLPDARAQIDPGTEFLEVLGSLRRGLTQLADDLAAETQANIDTRITAFIRRLAAEVPEAMPREAQIFDLGLAKSNLTIYLDTVVKDEWPGFWKARIIGTMAHFDRVMGQLPAWREFIRNADNDITTPAETTQVVAVAQAVSAELAQTPDGLIDPAIGTAITAQIVDIEGLKDEGLTFNKQLLAYNTRENTRNIFKSLASEFVKWVKPGFESEHKEFGEKLGRAVHKFLQAVVVGAGVATVSAVSGLSLAQLAIIAKASPELIHLLSGKEGWVAFFLAYVISAFQTSDKKKDE